MRLAHVVLAHRLPGQLARLVARLRHPGDVVLVHVDARQDLGPFTEALGRLLEDGRSVRLLPRVPCVWGGFGLVEAALHGLRAAGDAGYVCLHSGQDYPLVPREVMAERLAAGAGSVYLEHFAMPLEGFPDNGGLDRVERLYLRPSRRWSLPNRFVPFWPRRALPHGLQPYGGRQFWCLPGDVAGWLVEHVDAHPELVRFFRRTFVADETFFPTLLLNGPHAGRVVDDDLHFAEFPPGSSHPRLLGPADIPVLRASGDLFARKFEGDAGLDAVDAELLSGGARAAAPRRS